MFDGFVRVAAIAPKLCLANCRRNAEALADAAARAAMDGAALVVFPELCLTGYTCGDLFGQRLLLDEAEAALLALARQTGNCPALLVVGLPWRHEGALYNVAAVLHRGRVLGLVPKLAPPNYAEFYEARHFQPGPALTETLVRGSPVPLGWRQLFHANDPEDMTRDFVLGVELCEDLWTPHSPSTWLAVAGATVIANPSASPEAVGKADYRRALVGLHSAKTVCGYIYAGAGDGESTTDLVFGGHQLIVENGALLAERKPFSGDGDITADLDVRRLAAERMRQTSFHASAQQLADGVDAVFRRTEFEPVISELSPLRRPVARHPFVPDDPERRRDRCEEVLAMQTAGLAARMRHTKARTLALGLSGGLDSTLAFLVAVRAADRREMPREKILAITMPGPGTTPRTRGNAERLTRAFNATLRVIPIHEAVRLHFRDIGHDPALHDVTFENAQARERTQILMDLANRENGLVVGTGDLSELALGWTTYNGDHMSMYGVNAGVPKTLVRYAVAVLAETAEPEARETLMDILATPISPELLPSRGDDILQRTEDMIGPYALHDFFLYHTVRLGFPPRKIARLARQAFAGEYGADDIARWQRVFYTRFFAQQFKRSCMPDGPKVGSVSLSPRGDWRMPSDAGPEPWLNDGQGDK